MTRMRTLHTSHFALEPQLETHAHAMFEVLSDPAIYEFENAPPPSLEWLVNRYSLLETRVSTDGTQQWLNWVIRLPGEELAGYVQATVMPSGSCLLAYELASRYWRRGIGRSAVQAVSSELESSYGVQLFVAVLKSANYRSLGLLRHLGFTPADAQQMVAYGAEPDEIVMVRLAGDTQLAD